MPLTVNPSGPWDCLFSIEQIASCISRVEMGSPKSLAVASSILGYSKDSRGLGIPAEIGEQLEV